MTCPCDDKATPAKAARQPDGLDYYIAGIGGTRGVIIAPDIFGTSHPSCHEFCDALARRGFVVCMPDFFRGKPWDVANFPPPGGMEANADFQAFRARIAQYDAFMPDVRNGAMLLRGLGARKVAVIGLCWGGKIALRANCLLGDVVDAAVGTHPSRLEPEDGANAKGPVCLLLSAGEPPLEELQAELAKKDFAAKNVVVRYPDLAHGFHGARGPGVLSADPADATGARVLEALETLIGFLDRVLA